MKTNVRSETSKPSFGIRIHLTDGSVESFAQEDAAEAQKLWDRIEPSRLFAQARLVLAGERSKSVYVTAQAPVKYRLVVQLPNAGHPTKYPSHH